MKVKFTTSKGDMVAELFNDATPKTVDNFTKLISEGFYNDCLLYTSDAADE